ncbi:MAG: secretin N-terminal domain-containing protein [Candidatus Omnitrophica bacterium]|nr:secretin N-terminal domain-containing protein [Candidatus Omnitrophota bacterium]
MKKKLLFLFIGLSLGAWGLLFAQENQNNVSQEILPEEDVIQEEAPLQEEVPQQEEAQPELPINNPQPGLTDNGQREQTAVTQPDINQQEPVQQIIQPQTQPAAIVPLRQEAQSTISLDIKGMDVVDVLKMLATRAGINLVVGKNVTGRVTLFLKDVDIWSAFELILLSNDLAYERKGDIVSVVTQRDYELQYGERFQDKKRGRIIQLKYAKAADLSRALTQMKSNVGKIVVDEASNTVALIDTPEKIKEMEGFIAKTDLPLQTRIFSLNYATADKLNKTIQEALTKGVGSMRVDERTNKLVITDFPSRLDEIAKIISAFDEKTPQVLIDAQIIEIRPSDKFEMGVDWEWWIKNHFKLTSALPIGTTGRLLVSTARTAVTKPGDYKGVLDLLRTIGDTKILSSPRIMALNNQEAKILVGTKDAYITSTTSQSGTGTAITSQAVNFVDVGIKLFVTPTISREGFVTMKIKPEVSSATRESILSENQTTQIPIVTTSEAETTVMVKDGVTIIIGGLKKESRVKTVKKLPLIGDIPLVGFFFRSTSDDVTTTDLVILLTPHIMSGDVSYTDFEEIKPEEGARLRLEKGKIVKEMLPDSQEQTLDMSPDEYYKSINDRINALALFSNPKSAKGKVMLVFTLNRSGLLVGQPKIVKSTNAELSAHALDAVEASSPFTPFPKAVKGAKKRFKITLVYK